MSKNEIVNLNRGTSLRKPVFRLGQLIAYGNKGAGGGGPGGGEPAIDYLLNATFHRYGPAGPLALVNGNILDDTGTAAAEIDKGSLTYEGAGGATLQNERMEYVVSSGSSLLQMTDRTLVPGMTVHFVAVKTAIQGNDLLMGWARLNNNAGASAMQATLYVVSDTDLHVYCKDAAGVQAENLKVVSNMTGGEEQDLDVISGGFNASLEPDPAGNFGWLFRKNGALIYSSVTTKAAINYEYYFGSASFGHCDTMQSWVDTAPLATPHRSLFATDHVAISDYTPENGGAWTDESVSRPSFGTSGGQAVPSQGARNWATVEGGPKSFIEVSASGSQCCIGFRIDTLIEGNDNGTIGWFAGDESGTGLAIYENPGTGWVKRGSGVAYTQPAPGRYIVTDDGANIAVIEATTGTVQPYASTAGAAATKLGIASFAAAARWNWFCSR